jgi:hypothetical protein
MTWIAMIDLYVHAAALVTGAALGFVVYAVVSIGARR